MICISKEDKLENPMQCYFPAMYLRLPFSIAPEFVKANSEKAQGLSRRARAGGRSVGRFPQKLGSRAAAVEMIMFTVQTFPQPKYRACLEPLARIAREIPEYEK